MRVFPERREAPFSVWTLLESSDLVLTSSQYNVLHARLFLCLFPCLILKRLVDIRGPLSSLPMSDHISWSPLPVCVRSSMGSKLCSADMSRPPTSKGSLLSYAWVWDLKSFTIFGKFSALPISLLPASLFYPSLTVCICVRGG